MCLNEDFKNNPEDFLKKKVIVVPGKTDIDYDSSGAYQFTLEPVPDTNLVLLIPRIRITGDFIYAYYLPWKRSVATKMTLGSTAGFFFTSHMTNCRFTIIEDNPKAPLVAHVAGNGAGGSDERHKFEEASQIFNAKARRLSVGGSRGVKPLHNYAGGFTSSAFTFGKRNIDGSWSFYAQIVEGDLSNWEETVKGKKDFVILDGFFDLKNLPLAYPKKIVPAKKW